MIRLSRSIRRRDRFMIRRLELDDEAGDSSLDSKQG